MTRATAEQLILTENQHARSRHEHVEISHAMWDHNVVPAHDGIRLAEMEEHLDLDLQYNVETSVRHLREIDIIVGTAPPGPDFYAISESLDEIVLGRVDEVAEADSESIIDHMHDDDPVSDDGTPVIADGSGATIRGVLAEEFDIIPEAVEDYLRHGDQVEKLNEAVDAIREADGVEARDDYGKIIFRRGAFRYTLTPYAVDLYEAEEEED